MTIFDNIRYPVSPGLPLSFYNSLPEPIRRKWATLCFEQVGYSVTWGEDEIALGILRQCILEYEDDNI